MDFVGKVLDGYLVRLTNFNFVSKEWTESAWVGGGAAVEVVWSGASELDRVSLATFFVMIRDRRIIQRFM